MLFYIVRCVANWKWNPSWGPPLALDETTWRSWPSVLTRSKTPMANLGYSATNSVWYISPWFPISKRWTYEMKYQKEANKKIQKGLPRRFLCARFRSCHLKAAISHPVALRKNRQGMSPWWSDQCAVEPPGDPWCGGDLWNCYVRSD